MKLTYPTDPGSSDLRDRNRYKKMERWAKRDETESLVDDEMRRRGYTSNAGGDGMPGLHDAPTRQAIRDEMSQQQGDASVGALTAIPRRRGAFGYVQNRTGEAYANPGQMQPMPGVAPANVPPAPMPVVRPQVDNMGTKVYSGQGTVSSALRPAGIPGLINGMPAGPVLNQSQPGTIFRQGYGQTGTPALINANRKRRKTAFA